MATVPGIEGGFAEASQTIFQVALQLVGGLFTGMIDAYLWYLKSGTPTKVGGIAGLAFATLVLFLWHKNLKDKGSSGVWAVEMILIVTRIFLTFSVVGIFMPESISRPFFYSLFTAIIVLNIGLGRIVGGWIKSAGEKSRMFGDIEKAPWEATGISTPEKEKLKNADKEMKTLKGKIEYLGEELRVIKDSKIITSNAKILFNKKKDLIINKKYCELKAEPTEKDKFYDILKIIQDQTALLRKDLEFAEISGYISTTDITDMKKLEKELPNTDLLRRLRMEEHDQKKIIDNIKRFLITLKELDNLLTNTKDLSSSSVSINFIKGFSIIKLKASGKTPPKDLQNLDGKIGTTAWQATIKDNLADEERLWEKLYTFLKREQDEVTQLIGKYEQDLKNYSY